jgi:NAD(P)-dependent dehydrogenase (short-subunit alcohol dehydrogenase family)
VINQELAEPAPANVFGPSEAQKRAGANDGVRRRIAQDFQGTEFLCHWLILRSGWIERRGVDPLHERKRQLPCRKVGTVRIDVLINNAGVISVAPMEEMTEEDYLESLNVSYADANQLTVSSPPAA